MVKNKLSIALILVVALLLVGCSDLASIEIIYDSLPVIEPGQRVNLTAVGKTALNMNAEFEELRWELSDKRHGTLDLVNDGVVFTALEPGFVTISAISGDISGSVTFEIVDVVPDPVVFFESFEDGEVGEYPEGWIVLDQEAHDLTGYSGGRISRERATHGSKSAKIVSIPNAEGRITYEFDKPLLYNTLKVDFLMPEGQDNINLELHGESGRLFGLFITASGNVRYRHPDGSNGSNISNASNNRWHTAEFQWNDEEKIYHAFVTSDGNRVQITPPGGSPYEELYRDEQVIKFSAMITKRDGDKTFYIDNIEVIDLEVLERLSK